MLSRNSLWKSQYWNSTGPASSFVRSEDQGDQETCLGALGAMVVIEDTVRIPDT